MPRIPLIYACLVLLAGCSETFEHHFSTFDEAAKSQSYKGRWIPQWLPKSASEIRDKYKIDTTYTLVTFVFTSSDKAPFNSDCSSATKTLPAPHLTASWWPNDLRGTSMGTHRYEFFDCPSENGALAVLASERRAYFWRYGS